MKEKHIQMFRELESSEQSFFSKFKTVLATAIKELKPVKGGFFFREM